MNRNQSTETLTDEVQALQQENEALQQRIEQYQQNERIDRVLWRAGARNPIAARALLAEKEMLTLSDEELEKEVQMLQEHESYLFYPKTDESRRLKGFTPEEGSDPQLDAFMNGFLNQ